MKVKLLTPLQIPSVTQHLPVSPTYLLILLFPSPLPMKPLLGILPGLAFLSFILQLKFHLLWNLPWNPSILSICPLLEFTTSIYFSYFWSLPNQKVNSVRTGILSILFSTISLTALSMTWHIVHGGRILNEQVCKDIKRYSPKDCLNSNTSIAKNWKQPKSWRIPYSISIKWIQPFKIMRSGLPWWHSG